jgi:A/G-specific adenine glycosylase
MKKEKFFVENIINWYDKFGRKDLPWRLTNDPWKILLAAILLKKTTVKQVLKIYNFLANLSPEDILNVDENWLKDILRPLGMENERAKLLKKLSKELVENFKSKVPCDEKLKQLPGVGEYTLSEVMLLACGEKKVLLDRNMIRVLERFFPMKSSKKRPRTDKNLWSKALELVPEDIHRARKFNLGVLDFASEICKARNPKCSICPLNSMCFYYSLKHSS